MADYIAPTGPPPPRVPEGWKAVWNQQYSEWFYVNLYTKESSWEKPTAPAHNPNGPSGGDAPPPGYNAGPNAPNVSDHKKTTLDSNNPYNSNNSYGGQHETDEEMARRLQREEQERRQGGHSPNPATVGDRGHSDSYYQNSTPAYGQQQVQTPGLQGGYPGGPTPGSNPTAEAKRSSGGGLFGKLKDKLSNPQSSSGGMGGMAGLMGGSRPQQGYGGYPQQQHGYGGYPQQHGGGYGGYGGYPQHGGGHGMMPGMMPGKKKAGMGAGGAAALGVGGGLLGGMMLANAMDDDDYGGGGDFDGGDMGDMGGDF